MILKILVAVVLVAVAGIALACCRVSGECAKEEEITCAGCF